MTEQEVLNYIMDNPGNTNYSVLAPMVKALAANSSSSEQQIGPDIGTTYITLNAQNAYDMFTSYEEIIVPLTGIEGDHGPMPAMLKCVLKVGDVETPFYLQPMSYGYYGGAFYTNSKLYYIVCQIDPAPKNPSTAHMWAYVLGED